jgi:hypothetical protein
VGLFDSGAAEDAVAVRQARVTQVIPPLPGAPSPPPLPNDEQQLVPEYYRKSPFSSAWLKITEISDAPIAFFGSYSYDVAPPLPHIPPAYLSRLVGKRVYDAAELRAMDVTIWRVRPSVEGDLSERFLAPSIRIQKPLSNEPIAVKGPFILHLTDLHFAAGPNAGQHRWDIAAGGPNGTLAEQVGLALRGLPIGIIIVSGDFTYIAHADEFDLAERSINALLGSFGLGPDNLVIVPGNHDIAWTAGDAYNPATPVAYAPEAARTRYQSFYTRLMRHPPNTDFSMARRFVLPNGAVVDVCGLNSSSLEQGPHYLAGMGRVTPIAFGRVREAIEWRQDRPAPSLRIIAIHHHLTATEDLENAAEYSKGFGMAIDAKRILRDAAQSGVQLILHGHRHRCFVWNEGVYARPEFTEQKWNLGQVGIVGGGSVGSTDVDGNRNFFNLLELSPEAVNLHIYRSQNAAAFERMTTWKAATSLKDGQFCLGDWIPATPG